MTPKDFVKALAGRQRRNLLRAHRRSWVTDGAELAGHGNTHENPLFQKIIHFHADHRAAHHCGRAASDGTEVPPRPHGCPLGVPSTLWPRTSQGRVLDVLLPAQTPHRRSLGFLRLRELFYSEVSIDIFNWIFARHSFFQGSL